MPANTMLFAITAARSPQKAGMRRAGPSTAERGPGAIPSALPRPGTTARWTRAQAALQAASAHKA
jgi:hypothetical protein